MVSSTQVNTTVDRQTYKLWGKLAEKANLSKIGFLRGPNVREAVDENVKVPKALLEAYL